MKYCTNCLYPQTKPDIWFNEDGKCSACLAYDARANKNWDEWEVKFRELFKPRVHGENYDCLIPVSGGKDSHYQVIKVLEYGFNPLCVCARTDDLTPIGRRNLDNIGELGVDLIEVNTNRKVRKRLAKYGLETVGDISWAEHATIFTIPFYIAAKYDIPLIIYGENPQNEYGAGPKGTEEIIELDTNWLHEFGGLNGLRVDDIISNKIATKEEMYLYQYHYSNFNPKAIFLGQFFPWDGSNNAKIASLSGMEYYGPGVEGTGGCAYENLDNFQTGIHDYFKYLKFGFGRATDIISSQLRRKSISRDEAKDIIIASDGYSYKRYLGRNLDYTLHNIGMTEKQFMACVDKFTNTALFEITNSYPKPKFLQDLRNA